MLLNLSLRTSLGKCQKLKVFGFVFSKETFGARVQLSDEQLDLFDQGCQNCLTILL